MPRYDKRGNPNRIPMDASPYDEYEEDVDGLAGHECPQCRHTFRIGERCFHFSQYDPRRAAGPGIQDYICQECMKLPGNTPLRAYVKE